jgi:hypothetical protein
LGSLGRSLVGEGILPGGAALDGVDGGVNGRGDGVLMSQSESLRAIVVVTTNLGWYSEFLLRKKLKFY